MKKRRAALFVLSLSVLLLALGLSVRAWFSLNAEKTADVGKTPVAEPPTIGVLNNETGQLDVLNLDGLMLPNPQCIVFCVTPSGPDLVDHFALQLAYTENMSESIEMYACSFMERGNNVTLLPSDVDAALHTGIGGDLPQAGEYVACAAKATDSDVMYYYRLGEKLTPTSTSTNLGYTQTELASNQVAGENQVLYKFYRDTGTETALRFQPITEGDWEYEPGNECRFKYYMLYIHWPEGMPQNLDSKETDVVYISSKGIAMADDG